MGRDWTGWLVAHAGRQWWLLADKVGVAAEMKRKWPNNENREILHQRRGKMGGGGRERELTTTTSWLSPSPLFLQIFRWKVKIKTKKRDWEHLIRDGFIGPPQKMNKMKIVIGKISISKWFDASIRPEIKFTNIHWCVWGLNLFGKAGCV